jgi:alpha-galactosidase
VHWGADLGPLAESELEAVADALIPAVAPSSIDSPLLLSLVPVASDGWSGRPGVSGARGRRTSYPLFESRVEPVDAATLVITLDDAGAALSVDLTLALAPSGVLQLNATVTNTGRDEWSVEGLSITLPLPGRASELLDFGGRWTQERRPQRRTLADGSWRRATRHGRPGHDDPFVTVVGEPGFDFRRGAVWAAHLAWSGDRDVSVETASTGHVSLALGELLQPGEVVLAPGETYSTPLVVAAWSATGLDGLSEKFHAWVRARHVPSLPPRGVVLNTWEAVYFDHDLDRLTRLAEIGARLGVERFVLDDGWMTGRTDDTKALGDWTVDPVRWPGGLRPLIDRVNALGMDFGLWVEPEMVCLDSDLARAHPDWIVRAEGGRLPQPWRNQFALDLGNPEAFANILAQLSALLDEYPIAYLKWDQNRDLLAGSTHRQTVASWRLMDELRQRYPGLEIESCSSGGARVDLGVLDRTDRFWVSDTNDPLERQAIQRFTGLLVPPEFLGSHLGAPVAHTTGRATELSFRLATAFFLSAGIEWDLTRASEDERAQVLGWTTLYRQHRALLHSGTTVRTDASDDSGFLHGVVSPDRDRAIVAVVRLTASREAVPAPVRVPGLDPDRTYRIEALTLGREPRVLQDAPPPWFSSGDITLPGRVIAETGFAIPLLLPAQALLLSLTAV